MSKFKSNAYDSALRLLARREHGRAELSRKLKQRGFEGEDIETAIGRCENLGLQDQRRFAESLCRRRIQQGYGPVRIQLELKSQQLDANLIADVLAEEKENWLGYALALKNRKFKTTAGLSFAEIQKQKQYLLYRGFSADMISQLYHFVQDE